MSTATEELQEVLCVLLEADVDVRKIATINITPIAVGNSSDVIIKNKIEISMFKQQYNYKGVAL